ncbi:MAG: SpoIID/LytB domain-containing protein, partial [Ilumatobacteraceae bacterium]
MIGRLTQRVIVVALAVTAGVVVAAPATPIAEAVPAASVDGRIAVRLQKMDGQATVGVISATSGAIWNGSSGYAALKAERIGDGEYRVSASAARVCPGAESLEVPDGVLEHGMKDSDAVRSLQTLLGTLGHDPQGVDGSFGDKAEAAVKSFQAAEDLSETGRWTDTDADRARELVAELGHDGWTELGVTEGPVTFATAGSETHLAPGDTLGLCRPSGAVAHYRGQIVVTTDADGAARAVNQLSVENYLRGVVPREVSSSWGDAAGGAGMNALRAQAVAARSYAVTQARYSYADTCDTTACQAYGGAASRAGAAASANVREDQRTDRAIRETAGQVRVWPDGDVVSTEYSASNGPYTAGGSFPSVEDPTDAIPANPNHSWTRVLDVGTIGSRHGVAPLSGAATQSSDTLTSQGFVDIWAREVHLEGSAARTLSSWDFRGAHHLPSPGFGLIEVTSRSSSDTFAFIGDSVGASVASPGGPLRSLLAGSFAGVDYDAVGCRKTTTRCGDVTSGLEAASEVPQGTDLVIVELGYNDPDDYADKIDEMMDVLAGRDVGRVAWVNLTTRSGGSTYAAVNAALDQATSRHPDLTILDWNEYSSGNQRARWFSDGLHLTATGRAEFARYVNDQARSLSDGTSTDSDPLRAVIVEGVG